MNNNNNYSYITEKQERNKANERQAIYNTGYRDGFERGLIAARQCSNCEYIGKCQDDPQKTDYCPNSELRYNCE